LPEHLIAEDPMPNAKPYVLVSPRARRTPDLGILTTLVTCQMVDAALAQHGAVTKRLRRLPMHLLVYFQLAMALLPSLSYLELQTRLEGGWQVPGAGPWRRLTSSAISHARQRLPWQVMWALFSALAIPGFEAGGGRWRGFHLVAIDGSSMEMATSSSNEAEFAGPTGKNGRRVGYPQLRILTLVNCWTRAALAAAVADFGRGEGRLAAELVGEIERGMLVLADRGFVGIELMTLIRQAGAEVLWRVKKGIATHPLTVLPDGSYLAEMRARAHHGRGWITGKRPPPITVRIIEFKLNGQLHRLLTTLLDPVQAPARELILLYSQRWQIETFYRECKGNEQGRRRVLRSRTCNGVYQEIWATLITHLLTRALICWVVDHSHQVDDPKVISFKHATAFIQDHLRAGLRISRPLLLSWAMAALTQPAALLRPPPKPRSNPRQVKARPIRYQVRNSRATATVPFDPASIVPLLRLIA
jgi:hypothetical protein